MSIAQIQKLVGRDYTEPTLIANALQRAGAFKNDRRRDSFCRFIQQHYRGGG